MGETKVVGLFDDVEVMPNVVKTGKRILIADKILSTIGKVSFPVNNEKYSLSGLLSKLDKGLQGELETYLNGSENRVNRCASFTLVLRQRANLKQIALAFSSVSGKIYFGRKR